MRRKVRWTPRLLVWVAVLMAWGDGASLGDRFEQARRCVTRMFPSRRRVGRSYQGFTAALIKHTPRLLAGVQEQLRGAMRTMAAQSWLVEGWLAFAVDGSRIDAARTAANERALGGGGKGQEGPKQWLTTLVHMGMGLPWDWRIGRGDASERHHLRQMLGVLPRQSLLVADAGFTGYDLLREVIDGGRHLLIRVGSNVTLLRELGYEIRQRQGIVYLWPAGQRRAGRPPLVLRLIVLRNAGKGVHLLTDVLDAASLPDSTAGKLYRMRWGVEVFYRSLKQTLGRRKMRSAAPRQARVELHWTMVGLWLVGLLGARALLRAGDDPRRLSAAAALRCVRGAMRQPRGPRGLAGLRHATIDGYRRLRPKAARHWPHKKHERPPGAPKTRYATATEVLAAQRLRQLPRAA